MKSEFDWPLAGCPVVFSLLIVTMGLFAAGAAQAQNVWSASLTVDALVEYFGCDNGDDDHEDCSETSVLSDDDFNYNGTTFTVSAFYWHEPTDKLSLVFSGMTAVAAKSALSSLTLTVNGTALAVSESTTLSSTLRWDYDPGTDWEDETVVTVTLGSGASKPKVVLELGASTIAESGSGNSTTLKATVPSAVASEVTVTVSAAPAGTVSLTGTTLTIAANARESGTVTVTAVDNNVDAADARVTISGTVSGTAAEAPDDVVLTVQDDDGRPKAALVLGAAAIAESGAGNSTTLKARLSRAVSSDVTVTVSAAPVGAVQFASSTVTIAANALESGTITVTALDNDVDAPDASVTISATVSGTAVDAPDDVTLTVTDDDGSGEETTQPKDDMPAPRELEVTPRSSGLDAAWSPPVRDNRILAVTGYNLGWRPSGASDWTVLRLADVTRHGIDGLENGTLYEVRVQAVNGTGNSRWSEIASGTPEARRSIPPLPVEPTVDFPAVPEGLGVSSQSTRLIVTWRAPAAGEESLPVTGYNLAWRPAGAGDWTVVHLGDVVRHTIDGLEDGTLYEVRVQAVSAGFEGAWSPTVSGMPAVPWLAPYWQGAGGFVVRPADGRSALVRLRCAGHRYESREYAGDDGLIVRYLQGCFGVDGRRLGGDLSLQGIEDGGWYWLNGDRNVAVAPLVVETSLNGGLRPPIPEGVAASPSGDFLSVREISGRHYGTLVVHDQTGIMGIVPHLVDMQGGGAHAAPYWKGEGGIVGRPLNGESAKVRLSCGDGEPETYTLEAGADGTIVTLLPAGCFGSDGGAVAGDLEADGLEDGAWYWINGSVPFAAPLVGRDRGDDALTVPLVPEGVTAEEGPRATLFERGYLAGIVPRVRMASP